MDILEEEEEEDVYLVRLTVGMLLAKVGLSGESLCSSTLNQDRWLKMEF